MVFGVRGRLEREKVFLAVGRRVRPAVALALDNLLRMVQQWALARGRGGRIQLPPLSHI